MKTVFLTIAIVWIVAIVACYGQEPRGYADGDGYGDEEMYGYGDEEMSGRAQEQGAEDVKRPTRPARRTLSAADLQRIEDRKRRTWTSADGKYTVGAKFLSLIGEVVSLERDADGKSISLRLSQLSEADRDFIRQRRWLEQPVQPVQPQTGSADPVSVAEKPAVASAGEASLGPWGGFRGIAWGTNIADLPDMVLQETADERLSYERKGEILTIGNARLESVSYLFYKSRFMMVAIYTLGASNRESLENVVLARYGEPHVSKRDGERLRMGWSQKDAGVVLTFHGDVLTTLNLSHLPITKEWRDDVEQQEQKRTDKAAAEDF